MGRSKYDGAIRRFLELVAAKGHPKPSDWAAARQVAKEQGAQNREQYAEGLRKRYRVLRDRRELPAFHRQAIRDERMSKLLENAFSSREAAIKNARAAVKRLGRQARKRGITDLSPEGLVDQRNALSRRKHQLELVTSTSELGVGLLMEKKLGTAEATNEEYLRLVDELDRISRDLELISELRENVGLLLAVGLFPQNRES